MSRHPARRDPGMTLIELLVSIMVIGAIVAVLSATLVVTFRQQGDTQGRLDVARWAQSLALWLPSDLASATDVDANTRDPDTSALVAPCPSAECTFGSNALLLTWDDGTGTTTLSYRYGPAPDGATYMLTRVECKGGVCTSRVVLRDLSQPVDDDGNPVPWSSGDPVPNEVIDVTVPLKVLETDPDGDLDDSTRAQRVIVNVNGAPGVGGQDRSSAVSFTAGGSSLETLEATTFSGPTFLQANSGCGGPVTLIVDKSGSIDVPGPAQMGNVRAGISSFVQAFEGTPTRLQIITFDTKSATLGASSPTWNRFFDLADPAQVDTLIGPTGTGGYVGSLLSLGGTNWEDAFHRAFYTSTGTPYSPSSATAPKPELVVFFTDGVPTFDRVGAGSYTGSTVKSDTSSIGPSSVDSRYNHTTDGGGGSYGSAFSPRGWFRADYIVGQFRGSAVDIIGVGVGAAFGQTTLVERSGWPAANIPNAEFLGQLVSELGGDPSQYGTPSADNYITRTYNPALPAGTGWGDVSQADVLVTTDWAYFGSALTAIALADCGGTLTVQTRDMAGAPADADVTYYVGEKFVTTQRIEKSGTFDIPLAGLVSTQVVLVPSSLEGTIYTAQSWSCRAKGVTLGASDWHLVNPADVMAGIEVTVRNNAAVSCTLKVSP